MRICHHGTAQKVTGLYNGQALWITFLASSVAGPLTWKVSQCCPITATDQWPPAFTSSGPSFGPWGGFNIFFFHPVTMRWCVFRPQVEDTIFILYMSKFTSDRKSGNSAGRGRWRGSGWGISESSDFAQRLQHFHVFVWVVAIGFGLLVSLGNFGRWADHQLELHRLFWVLYIFLVC